MEKLELLKKLGFSEKFLDSIINDKVDDTVIYESKVSNPILDWPSSFDTNNLIIKETNQPISLVINNTK